VPAVRFSRDKRGYEYVYLVHTPMRRGKPGRSRVLYWYRTPPGVRVGRKPFDPEVQRMLEEQNPGVAFDWDTIVSTPMPPPDMTEFWRERRRAEKAARQERRAMEAGEAPDAPDGVEVETSSAGAEPPTAPTRGAAETGTPSEDARSGGRSSTAAEGPIGDGGSGTDGGPLKKKRRRRGGRRRAPGEAGPGASASGQAGAAGGSGDPAGNADADSDPSETDARSSEEE
jgi:hypothetical protein